MRRWRCWLLGHYYTFVAVSGDIVVQCRRCGDQFFSDACT